MNSTAIRRKPLGSPHPPEELSLLSPSGRIYSQDKAGTASTGNEDRSTLLGFSNYFESTPLKPNFDASKSIEPNRWCTEFWIGFPVLGIMALVMTVCSTIAAIIIAKECNNQAISSWSLSPSVLLAIISSLSNLLLSFALGEGLIISFWWNSLQGSTLRGLHDNWYAGTSAWGALKAGLRGTSIFNSLACIITLLSVIRGPLFQRAIKPISGIPVSHTGNMMLDFASNVSGTYGALSVPMHNGGAAYKSQTPTLREIIQSYSSDMIMTMDHPECGDSCSMSVNGFGLGTNCTYQNISVTKNSTDESISNTYFQVSINNIDPPSAQTWGKTNGNVVLHIIYLPQTDSPITNYTDWISTFTLVEKQCVLSSGIVSYDIILSNGTVALMHDDYSYDRFLYSIDNPIDPVNSTIIDGKMDLMGGFGWVADYLFTSQALYTDDGSGETYNHNGSLANQFMSGDLDNLVNFTVYWTDPTDYILNQLRQIAFRISLQAAKDDPKASNATQTVTYTGKSTPAIFTTHFSLIAVAAALNILAVVAILPTYHGWWALKRKSSLSPLETARAFNAPLLKDTNVDRSWRQILEKIGARSVRYRKVDGEITGIFTLD